MKRCLAVHAAHFVIFAVTANVPAGALRAQEEPRAQPETVMITYQAKAGSEAELARAIRQHWKTARDLKLVLDAPHVAVRETSSQGAVHFVEIFTWRDAGIPDAPPPEILAHWSAFGKLVEDRDGKSGIGIAVVSAVEMNTDE